MCVDAQAWQLLTLSWAFVDLVVHFHVFWSWKRRLDWKWMQLFWVITWLLCFSWSELAMSSDQLARKPLEMSFSFEWLFSPTITFDPCLSINTYGAHVTHTENCEILKKLKTKVNEWKSSHRTLNAAQSPERSTKPWTQHGALNAALIFHLPQRNRHPQMEQLLWFLSESLNTFTTNPRGIYLQHEY